jgi:hypothetical protein
MASSDRRALESKTYPSLYEFRVVLKEIDRFYDFEYAREPNVTVRRVDVVDGKPRLVFGVWGQIGERVTDVAANEKRTTLGWRYHDEKGKEVHPQDVNVLHCDVERPNSGPGAGPRWCRTFHRADSTPIGADNWLYVFRSKPGCKDPQFYEELYFEKPGVFQHMSDAERERAKREWERGQANPDRPDETPRVISSGASRKRDLSLPMEILEGSQRWRACYYFYLAPFQLPWDAVQQILRDLPGRAVSLDDDFYTDVFLTKRPDEVVPSRLMLDASLVTSGAPRIAQIIARGERADPGRDGYVCRILHLPNPLKEGLRRATDLDAALRNHEDALQGMAKAPKYRLARAIELFTSKDDGLRKVVAKRLDEYHREGSDRIDRLWRVARSHARALVAWIGSAQRRSIPSWTVFRLAQPDVVRRDSRLDPPDDPAPIPVFRPEPGACAFSDAVRYYARAPSKVRDEIATIIATVHARLPDLPAGQEWLHGNLDAFLKLTEKDLAAQMQGQSKPAARGGLDLVFVLSWNKKWGKGATTALTGIHWAYATSWAEQNRDIVKLVDEINREVIPEAPVSVYPKALDVFKACAKTANGVREMLTLASDLRALEDHRDDALAWLKASGSAAKVIDSVRGSLDGWRTAITGESITPPKISLYAVYGHAVTLAVELARLGDARDSGERAGQLANITGLAIGLGTCFTSGGASVALNAVCWAFQFAGGKIKSTYSEPALYLYACEFGDSSRAPLFGNSPWAKLKAEHPGAWTIERQYLELEKLAYDFDCSIKVERGSGPARHPLEGRPQVLTLVIKPRYPHCLTADWVRSLDLTVRAPRAGARQVVSSLGGSQAAANAPVAGGLRLHKDHSLSIELTEYPDFLPGRMPFQKPETLAIEGTVRLAVPSSMTRDFKKSISLNAIPSMIGVAKLRSSWAEDAAKAPHVAPQGVVP